MPSRLYSDFAKHFSELNVPSVFLPKVGTPRVVQKYVCALLNSHKGGVIYLGINKDFLGDGVREEVAYYTEQALDNISPNPRDYVHVHVQGFSIAKEVGGVDCIIVVERSPLLYQIKETKPKRIKIEEKEQKPTFYIYNKNKIISYTDFEEARRMSDYIASGLPYILSYEPSDTEQRVRLKKIQEDNNVEIRSIGEIPLGKFFYKYVDLETFLLSLKSNKVRFNEPAKWVDKYESRFYNADYSLIGAPLSETPFLYAYCLTYSVESEAAWKVYTYQKQGLGAHCVELKINKNSFREHLLQHLDNCRVFVGSVNYMDSNVINSLHYRNSDKSDETPSEIYKTYFEPFNLYKYLNLILLKRKAFEHEKEVRFLIVPNNAETLPKSRYVNKQLEDNSEPKDITIDWLDIIEGIQIDSNCSDTECEILAERINSLVDAREDLSAEKKAEIKQKLTPSRFDVYGVVENVKIGDTK